MVIITLLGILSSVFTEVVTALNKKFTGTILEGDAAFLVTLTVAFLGATIKQAMVLHFNFMSLADWQNLGSHFTEIFAISQVYFYFIMKKLNLDVKPPVQG